jgi:excisionase family DNA binding protein
MKHIIMENISAEELKIMIQEAVTTALQERSKPEEVKKDDELLRLWEVADLLKVSKVTIHTWKRENKIPFYRISNKIYFKKNEVIASLNNKKGGKNVLS